MTDDRFLPKDRNGRLFRLIEEMGEVLHALGKAGRHGMESVNPLIPPEQQETNAAYIKRELADLREAMDAVEVDIDAFIRENAIHE